MPQQIPGIGSDVSALMPPVGADVSHLMDAPAAPRKPAATEDYLPPARSGLDHAKAFVMGFAHNVDPRPALKLVYDATNGLGGLLSGDASRGGAFAEDLKGLAAGQVDQFKKGYEAYKAGRYSEAAGHTLAGALPLVGPAAAAAGETIGSGDIAGGAGQIAGLVAGAKAPAIVAKVMPKSVRIPAIARNLNPEEVAAVELGQAHGVPVSAGTATGNKFVKGVQALADASPIGSRVAEGARAAEARGLATMGEQLAAKAHPRPVTAEQAGAAATSGVEGQVHEWHGEASKAYEKLRSLEADPANASTIQPEVGTPAPDAPHYFTMKAKPNANDVFLSALEDARNQGYKGTAADLKAKFDDRLASAKRLREASAEGDEYGDKALLKSIRDLGGLRMFDENYTPGAKTTRFTTEQDNVKGFFRGQRVYTEKGVPNDDMVMQLRQDPRWASRLPADVDLNEVLREIATKRAEPTDVDVQHYLRGEGVVPGVAWWNDRAPAQTIGMAVDLRDVKSALKPTFDALLRERELNGVMMGDKAKALNALDRLLQAPDHAPLSLADAALGDLKSFTRADNPDLRSVGQGKALVAQNALHEAISRAAEAAGPDAVQALTEGRQATQAKHIAAAVLEDISDEPAKAFTKLTSRGNTQHLRQVSAQTPEAMPQIGRAVLDGLLDKATSEGGFGHAPKLLADWQRISPETKQLLYRDSTYIKELDRFFLLAKKMSESPNPSGTALVTNSGAQLGLVFSHPSVGVPLVIGSGMLSKMLHSPTGVRLLTQGLSLPTASASVMANYGARLNAWVKNAGAAPSPAMADERRPPTPATIGQR